jgi:hypothetical protein
MIKFGVAALIIPMALTSLSVAQTGAVAKIDTYVAAVKRVSNSRREPKIVVADIAEYDKEKSEWKRFDSEKALEKYREEKGETYSIAYNWKRQGKLIATNFTDFSPSGDWSQYTFHYFREDGSLAKVEAELRTFYGDYIALRNYYYNDKGKQIKQTTRYLDLNTNKPKKPSKNMMDPNSFKPEIYKTVDKLPFASLVK